MQSSHSWILIGGTGQEFGITAATMALLGVVPIPERVILIDADLTGELYRDLELALDLVRYKRFASDEKSEPLVCVQPLQPIEHSTEVTLRQAFDRDPHLEALYAPSRVDLDTREGFKAEPQVGAASFFRPAFDINSPFRRSLQHIQGASGHVVTIVASVAGGTGSGLWQLVARLVRKLLPDATVRLLLIGPLLSLQSTDENDADGDRLTDHRLEANAAAGFRVALKAAELSRKERPFTDLYLLGYPSHLQRPKAPQERTGLRASRMTLIASTVLTHRPPTLPDHGHPGVFVFGDDVGARSEMSGISFTKFLAGDDTVEIPATDLGFIVAQTRKRLEQLRRTNIRRALAPLVLFRRRQLGRVACATIEKSELGAHTWRHEINSAATHALKLLERFSRWLSDNTDQYPHQLTSEPDHPAAARRSKHWQQAVDRAENDETHAKKSAFHARRWICAIGPGHIYKGPGRTQQPDAERTWLLPVTIVKQPTHGGWNRIGAGDVHAQFAYRSESFPTPFARAYWNHQNLTHRELTPEQQVIVNKSLEETRTLWLGLAGGILEIVREAAPSLDLQEKSEQDISILRVCAFIEEGRFHRDAAGTTYIPFLKVRAALGDAKPGEYVGAIHPICGPFLGPKHSALADHIAKEVEPRRAVLEGLLKYWLEGLEWTGAHPAWRKTIPMDGPPMPPEHVQARNMCLPLDGVHERLLRDGEIEIPFIGAAPTVLRLRNHVEGRDPVVIPSVLPTNTREEAEERYLKRSDAVSASFLPPHVEGDALRYENLPGGVSVRGFADFEDLEDWNIEVFPGDKAPSDWKEFGVAIEPAGGVADHKHYEIVIYVEDDRGSLRPVRSNQASWPAYWWVAGRPRLLCITRKGKDDSPPVIGFFPLLGPPSQARSLRKSPNSESEDTRALRAGHELDVQTPMRKSPDSESEDSVATIAMDLGTSRSFVAVQSGRRLEGAPFSYACKVVARSNEKRNLTLSGYTHWHPLRSMIVGNELDSLFQSAAGPGYAPMLEHSRVMLLPSNLVRRRHSNSSGPFGDYSIAVGGLPPEEDFVRIRDLKWTTAPADLVDYITLVLLTAVAQLDEHLDVAPRSIDLRLSYPLAFTFQHQGRLESAVTKAIARVKESTEAVFIVRYLDESMAGMYYVGLSQDSWKLSIDLGGGTADLALMHNSRMVVTDSVHLGGDLVMEKEARRRYPADSSNNAMHKLGRQLRTQRFNDVFESRAPSSSTQLLALAEDYAARLLAGTIVQLELGKRPSWLNVSDFNALRASVGKNDLSISLFLFGGAWRLAPLVHEFAWSDQADAKIQEKIALPMQARVNELLEMEGRATRAKITVQHRHLHRLGGEKAAVALGLLHDSLVQSLNSNMGDRQGILTVNGLDETFEGQARRWHEWVGKGQEWRQNHDTIVGQVTSQPLYAPEFTAAALRDWSLKTVLQTDSQLSMRLTPTSGNPIYKDKDRLKSAMGMALESCYRRKWASD